MKKVLSFVICLIMVFLIFTATVPVAVAAEYTGAAGKNIFWTLDTFSGELVFNGSGDMNDYSLDTVAPWSYYQSYIKEVTIGEGITSVGSFAFYNQTGNRYGKMKTVNLSSTVSDIDEYAFRGCKSITAVNGMTGVAQIGSYAFRSCTGLASIDLGNALVEIGNGCFSLCTSLDSIEFPSTLKTICSSAFEGCSALTEIEIPSSVTQLGDAAFADCTGLTDILYSAYSIIAEVYGVFTGAGSADGLSVVFNNNVTTVPAGLFYGCEALTSVTLGSGVTAISNSAFYATSISTLHIPAGVTKIDGSAFAFCNELTDFTVDSSNPYFSVGTKNELMNKEKTGIYRYPSGRTETAYATVASVDTIFTGAFRGDDDLQTVFASNVTQLDNRAFQECKSLSKVVLNKLTESGEYVFADCDMLIDISAPRLATIGSYSFFGCDSLYNLDGFTAVVAIGKFAFSNCHTLADVTLPSTAVSIGEYAFSNCETLMIVSLNEGLRTIGGFAFGQCLSITDITIPSTVTYIGSYAVGYKYEGGAYVVIPGFKIYCYSGTAGYNYANGMFDYEFITDSVEEGVVAPEQEPPEENTQTGWFDLVISVVRKVISFIMNLI